MMTDLEAKAKLEEAVSTMIGKSAMWSYRRLKTFRAEAVCAVSPDLQEHVSEILQEKELPTLPIEESENRLLLAIVVRNGGTNPALVELLFEGENLHITAWAKEGLIKQGTPQNAVDIFRKTLEV